MGGVQVGARQLELNPAEGPHQRVRPVPVTMADGSTGWGDLIDTARITAFTGRPASSMARSV
jgi:hypothetical protein